VTDAQRKLSGGAASIGTACPSDDTTSITQGLAQQEWFAEEGVDSPRPSSSALRARRNVALTDQILAAASTIGMDRVGLDFMLPMEKWRVSAPSRALQGGFDKQMVLSTTHAATSTFSTEDGASSSRRALDLPSTSRRRHPGAPRRGRVGRGHPP
jgi:predicted metal-dependent phosphotriesterase family hydrolase